MRLIYKVLLGFIIFNSMLLVFDQFFTGVDYGNADVTAKYNETPFSIDNLWTIFKDAIVTAGLTFVLILSIGIVVSNAPIAQMIGIGLIISVITGLYAGFSAPFIRILNIYPEGKIFYNVIIVCVAVVTAFSLIEIFTFKGDVD